MQSFKRYLPTLLVVLLAALPLLAHAASVAIPTYASGQDIEQASNSAGQRISAVLLVLTGILGTIFVAWGAIQLIFSEDKTKGKNTIIFTLIGVSIGGTVGGILRLATG